MDQPFLRSAFETLCQVAEERINEITQANNEILLDI